MKTESELRRTGRTTRLVDKYTQDFFTEDEVEIRDHVDNPDCHRELAGLVEKRIFEEHHKNPCLIYRAGKEGYDIPVISQYPRL